MWPWTFPSNSFFFSSTVPYRSSLPGLPSAGVPSFHHPQVLWCRRKSPGFVLCGSLQWVVGQRCQSVSARVLSNAKGWARPPNRRKSASFHRVGRRDGACHSCFPLLLFRASLHWFDLSVHLGRGQISWCGIPL